MKIKIITIIDNIFIKITSKLIINFIIIIDLIKPININII